MERDDEHGGTYPLAAHPQRHQKAGGTEKGSQFVWHIYEIQVIVFTIKILNPLIVPTCSHFVINLTSLC